MFSFTRQFLMLAIVIVVYSCSGENANVNDKADSSPMLESIDSVTGSNVGEYPKSVDAKAAQSDAKNHVSGSGEASESAQEQKKHNSGADSDFVGNDPRRGTLVDEIKSLPKAEYSFKFPRRMRLNSSEIVTLAVRLPVDDKTLLLDSSFNKGGFQHITISNPISTHFSADLRTSGFEVDTLTDSWCTITPGGKCIFKWNIKPLGRNNETIVISVNGVVKNPYDANESIPYSFERRPFSIEIIGDWFEVIEKFWKDNQSEVLSGGVLLGFLGLGVELLRRKATRGNS